MTTADISAHDPHPRLRADVGGVEMAYVDTGQVPGGSNDAAVFLHGNPTSSYLWRNIIPNISSAARCLAPDLMGMGESDSTPDGSYRFLDHSRYLDTWFETVLPDGRVVLVVHDWGSALGFHWARRHSERVAGLVYMEAIVRPVTWDEWPEAAKQVFQGFRSEAGESMVLERNIFVERVLPGSTINGISDEAMEVYRRRYAEPGRVATANAVLAPRNPHRGRAAGRGGDSRGICRMAVADSGAKIVRQRRAGGHPDRPATRILPRLPEPAGSDRPRHSLHPGRLTPRNRSRHRRVVRRAVNRLHLFSVTLFRSDNA